MDYESGVSPVIGQILMVALVVILAAIILSIVTGIVSNPLEDTKLAAFKIEAKYDGLHRGTNPKLYDASYLTYLQMAGDDLDVGYDSSVTHGGTTATRVTLMSPSGFHVVVDSVTMLDEQLEKGRLYYIFKYQTGSDPDDYYLTDNPNRIFGQQGIEPLEPGIWEIIISDIADSNTILFRGEVTIH